MLKIPGLTSPEEEQGLLFIYVLGNLLISIAGHNLIGEYDFKDCDCFYPDSVS